VVDGTLMTLIYADRGRYMIYGTQMKQIYNGFRRYMIYGTQMKQILSVITYQKNACKLSELHI
jgi:uncharacterized protein (UPF0548 family)